MSAFKVRTEALPNDARQSLVAVDRPLPMDGVALDLQIASRLSRSGLMIVDETRLVRDLNARARALLAETGVLGVMDGRLAIQRSMGQRSFEALLERGIAASLTGRPINEAIGIPDRSGATRYALCIVDIATREAKTELLLSLTDFADNSGPARSAFSTVLGLSQREAEFAELFSRGLNLEDISAMMGIAFNTARVHLQRICLKTNCSGQVALTRLLCRLSTVPLPIAPDSGR